MREIDAIRAAITANGGTPASYTPSGALRELVTAYGGTPTQYSEAGLLREAVTAVGGTPTKYEKYAVLRELLTAMGETPGYRPNALLGQWATAVATEEPLVPPAETVLAPFTSRAALRSPTARFTDQASTDAPSGASTVLRWTAVAGTTETLLPTNVNAQPTDVRNGSLHFRFKPIANANSIDRVSIELHSAGSPASPTANYHTTDSFGTAPGMVKAMTTNTTGEGLWQTVGFPVGEFTAAGTGADLSAITFVRFIIRSQSSVAAATYDFEPIYFQANAFAKAKAVLTFDNQYDDFYTTAFPAMEALGFKGVLMLSEYQNIGQPGYMTLAQIQEVKAAGWQIACQAYSTEVQATIDAMTDEERQAEVDQQWAYMAANGLSDTGRFFGSYFSNVNYRDLTAAPMFRDNFRHVRNALMGQGAGDPIQYGEIYPFADPMNVRALQMDSYTAANFATRTQVHFDQAITNKGVAIVLFHADMQNLDPVCDYLDANRSSIDVVTEDDLYYGRTA